MSRPPEQRQRSLGARRLPHEPPVSHAICPNLVAARRDDHPGTDHDLRALGAARCRPVGDATGLEVDGRPRRRLAPATGEHEPAGDRRRDDPPAIVLVARADQPCALAGRELEGRDPGASQDGAVGRLPQLPLHDDHAAADGRGTLEPAVGDRADRAAVREAQDRERTVAGWIEVDLGAGHNRRARDRARPRLGHIAHDGRRDLRGGVAGVGRVVADLWPASRHGGNCEQERHDSDGHGG